MRTRKIYFGLVYRPPSGNIDLFITMMDKIIGKLMTKSKVEVNFMGDMNINKRDIVI